METKNTLLLALGDGALNIVNQNTERLSEYFEISTMRRINFDYDTAFGNSSQAKWRSLLKLIPKEIENIIILNCIGGNSTYYYETLIYLLVEKYYCFFVYVYPFSFEGNLNYLEAKKKDNDIPNFHNTTRFYNDDMLVKYAHLPLHEAITKFNTTICEELIRKETTKYGWYK